MIFLINWAECRLGYLGHPTNIKKLAFYEKINFNDAVKDFSKEEIVSALHGLFKQKNMTIKSLVTKPTHFLENVSKYLNAELSKEYELYGKSKTN